ncbi:GTP cyclohydrolase I FolE [Elusimicrobiota bacterium]
MNTKARPRSLTDIARDLLILVGENPDRPELKRTPKRIAQALSELTSGYAMDLGAITKNAIYPSEDSNDIVLVKDIPFYSLCEHHMLPFWGKAHVAYLPNKKIIGLSKIPGIVQMFARRLQLQERLTHEIAKAIENVLKPSGTAVVLTARHMCLEMRGAKSSSSEFVTSSFLGKLKHSPQTRKQFFKLI